MNEQLKLIQEMKVVVDKIQDDSIKRLFMENATTCAASPLDEKEIASRAMLDSFSLMRGMDMPKPNNPLGSMMSLRTMESLHLTVSEERWVKVRRPWRARLYGGRLPLWRASAMLVVLLLAASFSGWLALALPVLSLCPRRWRVARQPQKICEQVPDPNYYIINGAIAAHPVTMMALKAELIKMEQEKAPRIFTYSLSVPKPKMTRAEYRRAFGVKATQ